MTIESELDALILQTQALDNTVSTELLDVNADIESLRARVTDLEIRLGMPDDDAAPSTGGDAPDYPTGGSGNDVIRVDTDAEVIYLWDPDTEGWVSIPFTAIATPVAVDVEAVIAAANASLDTEIEARVDAIVATVEGSISTTYQTQLDDLVSDVTLLGTTVGDNTAAVVSEAVARADADSALSSTLDALAVTVDDNHDAFIAFQALVTAGGDGASALLLEAMQAQIDDNEANLQTESTVRASADASLSSQITTLTAATNNNAAAIQNEISARAAADSAQSSQYTALAATVGTQGSAITTLESTVASLDGASAESVSTLTTTVGGLSATVSDISSSVNGIEAKRTIAINANGQVTGFELLGGGGSGSQVKFAASNFIVYDPNTSVTTVPFVISGGNTYIKQAVIKDADISTLKLAGNAVTQAVATYTPAQVPIPKTGSWYANARLTISTSGTQPILVHSNYGIAGAYQVFSAPYDSYYDGKYWNYLDVAGQLGDDYTQYVLRPVANGLPAVGALYTPGTGDIQSGLCNAYTLTFGITVSGGSQYVFTGVPAGTYYLIQCHASAVTNPQGHGIRNESISALETKR